MGFLTFRSGQKALRVPPQKLSSEHQVVLFGLRPITIVASVIALVQGMNQIADLAVSYLYKDDYAFSPVEVSFVICITSLPWMIKPLWGVISDNIPFFGYRRKSYLILWSILQFFYYFSLATWVHNRWLGVLLLMLIQTSIAFTNVIGEALVVESAQEVQTQESASEEQKQAEASKNVSLFFAVKYLGVLSTSYLSGLLLEFVDKHTIFFFTGALPLLVVLVSILIMKEKPHLKENAKNYGAVPYEDIPNYAQREGDVDYEHNDEKIDNNAELHSELNIFAANDENNWRRLVEFVKKPIIYRPILFLLFFMITPSSTSTMFYFYTNELKFSPNFLGQVRFANSVAGIFGIYIFNKYLKIFKVQKLLYWSTIVSAILGLSQILLVLRWNRHFGIPDELFCVSDSVILQSVAEINYLPVLILACRMCPKNMEGTMYALLMAILSFGAMISSQMGGAIAYMIGVTNTSFDNLWILIFISNFSMLLPLPFLRWIQFDNAIQETEEGTKDWLRSKARRSL